MTSARTERIEMLFHSVRELSPPERAAFLDRQCGVDDLLRQEVESLLANYRDASVGFLHAEDSAKHPFM